MRRGNDFYFVIAVHKARSAVSRLKTRQPVRTVDSPRGARFRSLDFSMDHRVTGERSDAVLRTDMPVVTKEGR